MKKIEYINILQGTKSNKRFSNGNTLPLIQMPNGMAAFSIQTRGNDGSWFFHPDDYQIEGFRLTHQPSPWIRDYGQLLFMPQSGEVLIGNDFQSSSIDKEKTILKPNYMKVFLNRNNIQYSLVPTTRGCIQRISYSEDNGHLIIKSYNDYNKITKIKIDLLDNSISGYTKNVDDTVKADLKEYFYMKFDNKLLKESYVFKENEFNDIDIKEYEGYEIGALIKFDLLKKREVEFKMAISYISINQAKINYNKELKNKSFNDLLNDSEIIWENELNKIDVKTNDENKLKTFYSSLYRTLLFPHKFYEYNENNEIIHFNLENGGISKGFMYVDIGFWDTFRTLFPLMTITRKIEVEKMINGFINYYKDTGFLPKWLAPSERGAMPGTLIDAVMADAVTKNLNIEKEEIFNALLNNARNGRPFIDEYLKFGYVINEHKENVNITQDYSYGDFCIAQFAKNINNKKIESKFLKLSKNYKNLVDIKSGLMRGKDKNGKFKENFNALSWGGDYCEGSAYQNSWFVPHDMINFSELLGGKDILLNKIDNLFKMKPDFEVGSYEKEIHEMSEMACSNFGQCAISNQPSFHIPYIFAELNEVNRSNYYVKKILNDAFSYEVDGFPGDEDNGSMAAWYILSSIGIYQFAPGIPEYLIAYCQFDEVLIKTNNMKNFKIIIENNNNGTNIEKAILNGVELNDYRIKYNEIIKGGELELIYK